MKGAAAPGFNREPDYAWQDYDWNTKEPGLIPFFAELDAEGKLGKFIADFGAGDRPVSTLIAPRSGRKIFTLDSDPSSPRARRNIANHFVLDVVGLTGNNTREAQRVMLEIFSACGKKIRPGTKIEGFLDSVIVSDLLNWLPDYQDVLRNIVPFIRPGGYLLIANQPGRGITTFGDWMFKTEPSRNGGPATNSELVHFLQSIGMRVESVREMGSHMRIDPSDIQKKHDRDWLVFVVQRPKSHLVSPAVFQRLRQSMVSLLARNVR